MAYSGKFKGSEMDNILEKADKVLQSDTTISIEGLTSEHSDTLYVCDAHGNVVAVINKNGLFANSLHADGINLLNQINSLQETLELLMADYRAKVNPSLGLESD